MNSFLLTIAVLLLVSVSADAADVDACNRLLMSQPPEEGTADPNTYFDDAEKVYRDCRGSELPTDVRVKALAKYATAKYIAGHAQSASAAYSEAIELLGRSKGSAAQLLDVLDKAVLAATDARLRTDAIAHAKRALALRRAEFGEDSPEVIAGIVNLSNVHIAFEELDQSESLLRAAVRTAEKRCASRCGELSLAYSGMSALYTAMGNEAEAKRYDELALSTMPVPVRKRTSTKD
ncbi:MAG TPA: tetratricopeptide repeat protein [Thermoanaerobaculia bacterium]|jgi:tetratricopeptide (TPR) repeat protein